MCYRKETGLSEGYRKKKSDRLPQLRERIRKIKQRKK